MIDEGTIKFESMWLEAAAQDLPEIADLVRWRAPLYDAGLIGHFAEHDVGYGNLSARVGDSRRFVISGTQTGDIARTDERHYARVLRCDIESNRVACEGPVQASSEALTHAAIYALDPAIRAIVHVHDRAMWDALIDSVPTTSREVSYGTPEMAQEFRRLYEATDFAQKGIAVMGGHEEGIVSFGRDVEQAAQRILQYRH